MVSRPPHPHPVLTLLLLVLILAPSSVTAQLEFGGVAWGTPVDSAAARIRHAGYVLRGQDQDGDWVFRGPDGVTLITMFDSAGLVGADLEWAADADRLPGRFERLSDSLRQVFGAPDSAANVEEQALDWTRGGVRVSLFLFPRGSGMDSLLSVRYQGPGWEAEFARRNEADGARMEYERENGCADTTSYGDWMIAYSDFRDLTRVDTVRFTRLGDRLYRARFLDDWFQRRRLENGMMYNGALTEVELDCRRMRARLLRIVPLYAHRALPAREGPEWLPPLPNRNHARAVSAACAALGRQQR